VADFLSDLPSRTQHGKATRSSIVERPTTGPSAAAQSIAMAASGSAAGDGSAGSRLHAIVTQHLRHQHRKACLRSAAPTTTLPPMSLLRRHELPQVRLLSCWHLTAPLAHFRAVMSTVPSGLQTKPGLDCHDIDHAHQFGQRADAGRAGTTQCGGAAQRLCPPTAAAGAGTPWGLWRAAAAAAPHILPVQV